LTLKGLIVALVGVSLFAAPALANRKMQGISANADKCKSMLKAKHFLKAPWEAAMSRCEAGGSSADACKVELKARRAMKDIWDAELNRCLDNPTTYQ
jgi:hypothetical protein